MERKRKIIIDIDTGVDDAQALIMALSLGVTVDVIAVTCVAGNTSLDNAYTNTLRVLNACNRLDIPVYCGCTSSLLGQRGRDASGYHGFDGLGDVQWPEYLPEVPHNRSQEHAAVAINRLVESNPGEVTLVALGPLTNLAVALKLLPHLGEKLGALVIMGGSIHDRAQVEFNFATDPEAANIVISQVGLGADRFFLVPIETCMESNFDWDWADSWMSTDTAIGRFHRNINRVNVAYRRSLGRSTYSTCDPCAMLIALTLRIDSKLSSCSATVTESVRWNASVDLHGVESRGQLRGAVSENANVTVVTAIDMTVYKQYLENMLQYNVS